MKIIKFVIGWAITIPAIVLVGFGVLGAIAQGFFEVGYDFGLNLGVKYSEKLARWITWRD